MVFKIILIKFEFLTLLHKKLSISLSIGRSCEWRIEEMIRAIVHRPRSRKFYQWPRKDFDKNRCRLDALFPTRIRTMNAIYADQNSPLVEIQSARNGLFREQ